MNKFVVLVQAEEKCFNFKQPSIVTPYSIYTMFIYIMFFLPPEVQTLLSFSYGPSSQQSNEGKE